MVSSVINNSAINDAVSRFDTANSAKYKFSRNVTPVISKNSDGTFDKIVNKVSYINNYPEDGKSISSVLNNYSKNIANIISSFNGKVRITPDASDVYFEKFKQYFDGDYLTYIQFKIAVEEYAKAVMLTFDDIMSTFEFYV